MQKHVKYKIFYKRYIQDVAIIVLILKFRKDKTIIYGPNVIFFSKINVYYVQTNYNEVVVLQQGGDVLMKKWQVQEKNTHERQRDVREKWRD